MCALCQHVASIIWHYSLLSGIMFLAQSLTSWTSLATGDSSSHRHAALWVLFAAWPKGARGLALLYSRDQNEFLCQRDKALLCSSHQARSASCFLSAVSLMETPLAAAHG